MIKDNEDSDLLIEDDNENENEKEKKSDKENEKENEKESGSDFELEDSGDISDVNQKPIDNQPKRVGFKDNEEIDVPTVVDMSDVEEAFKWIIKNIHLVEKQCGKTNVWGETKINLEKLANSNIIQTVEIRKLTKQANESTSLISGEKDKNPIVKFTCYFQELILYNLHFHHWKGGNLIAANDDGTSDPIIEFSVSSSVSGFKKKERKFSHSCRSDKIIRTLTPSWEEVGWITFVGTRSELQHAILECVVYDWDPKKSPEKIGESHIELTNIFDFGVVRSPLKLKTILPTNQEQWKDAGFVEGIVELKESSFHQQYGYIPDLYPGKNYLAVEIIRASNLTAMDDGISSDPYVVAEWEGCKLSTFVIEKTLEPKFNEILFFPLNVATISEEDIAKKGNITISVFDQDQAGDDILGMTSINLSDIVKGVAQDHTYEDQTVRSRTYSGTKYLLFNGQETTQGLEMRAWFHPDLPDNFKFENVFEVTPNTPISEAFVKRENVWLRSLPKLHVQTGAYLIKGADENNNDHFIPTYMTKVNVPEDLRSINEILRTIKAFPFENDETTFQGRQDVWCTQNFFLGIRKGSAEEHAMLLVNILLGLGMDAYFCYGITRSNEKHSWALVREDNGTVILFETAYAKQYRLTNAWNGKNVFEEDNKKELELEVEEIKPSNDAKIIPYTGLAIVANDKNLWGNAQKTLDPATIRYNFENSKEWIPFVTDDFDEDIAPFYHPKSLGPKLSAQRLLSIRNLIKDELIHSYQIYRSAEHMNTYIESELGEVIDKGLHFYEKLLTKKIESTDKDFLYWKGELSNLTPVGFSFSGSPLSFSYIDSIRIRKYIMEKIDFHKERDERARFAFGCHVEPYYHGMCMVWVMIVKLLPLPIEKLQIEDEMEETEEDKKRIEKNKKGKKKDDEINNSNNMV
ncbi:centrosomal protein of 76 kda [Anaeramoeba ignava]|uniref:Centrosomal protein of 76 kDa n=1 Tax=Anaeramoeba ignava TaxID=1746090 RepID=A0A9Q0RBZ9_ANAIG|nr:centrosomal protein of 76 kda [Anaeramoeba ignava]